MSHFVKISKSAREMLAVESAAKFDTVLRKGALVQPDGSWLIELDDSVFEELERQFGPFDASEAIIKLCTQGES